MTVEKATVKKNAPTKVKCVRVSWNDRLKQCKEFQKKHGHCKIPTCLKDDKSLGVWVQEMRRNFKLMKTGKKPRTKVTDEQVASLDEIGFEWGYKPDPTAPESDASWKANFEKLKEYKEKHGDFDIPIEGATENLGKWTRVQRLQNNLRDTKRKCFINKERINQLKDIGFDWKGNRKIDWKKA